MKKVTACSFLFVFTLSLTMGFVISFNDSANALYQCSYYCLKEYNCSNDTGPLCTDPEKPYYVYRQSSCLGGPLNCTFVKIFMYCWDGESQCPPIFPPRP
jgi:hypothetical protein